VIIDSWQFRSRFETLTTVLPDGCQDIICIESRDSCWQWKVSPFHAFATGVGICANSSLHGFRLAPGTVIDEMRLLGALGSISPDRSTVIEVLAAFTRLPHATTEILRCLAEDPGSISEAARKLGVRPRTMQRYFSRYLFRSPNYWLRLGRIRLRLGRIRQAGRRIASGLPLAEIAANSGYSDQSHLTRECCQWFGVTPAALRTRIDLTEQLYRSACA